MSVTALLPALLASAAALGLSPYAALAAQGAAAYVGLISLPPTLSGLASPVVWAPLLLLAVIQGTLVRVRTADLVSTALHGLVAPLAAALLVSAALPGPLGPAAWAVTLLALLIALVVHLYVMAVHTAAWTAGPARSLGAVPPLQLLGAAMLGLLAWLTPSYALAWAALIVLAPVPWAPRLLGAALLPVRALIVRLARPAPLTRWRPGFEALPEGLRDLARGRLAAAGGSLRNVRAAPVTLARWGPRWLYIHGWLVQEESLAPLFVHRRGFRPRSVGLEPGGGRVDHGLLVETLEVEGSRPYSLCVGPGGPGAPAILAAIERAVTEAEHEGDWGG